MSPGHSAPARPGCRHGLVGSSAETGLRARLQQPASRGSASNHPASIASRQELHGVAQQGLVAVVPRAPSYAAILAFRRASYRRVTTMPRQAPGRQSTRADESRPGVQHPSGRRTPSTARDPRLFAASEPLPRFVPRPPPVHVLPLRGYATPLGVSGAMSPSAPRQGCCLP